MKEQEKVTEVDICAEKQPVETNRAITEHLPQREYIKSWDIRSSLYQPEVIRIYLEVYLGTAGIDRSKIIDYLRAQKIPIESIKKGIWNNTKLVCKGRLERLLPCQSGQPVTSYEDYKMILRKDVDGIERVSLSAGCFRGSGTASRLLESVAEYVREYDMLAKEYAAIRKSKTGEETPPTAEESDEESAD